MSSLRPAFGPRTRLVWRLALLLPLLAIVVLALGGAIDSLHTGALTMLPALALVVMMATRPYLGERAIARLRARRSGQAPGAEPLARPMRREVNLARGGRLIAMALAGRAPPLALAACR